MAGNKVQEQPNIPPSDSPAFRPVLEQQLRLIAQAINRFSDGFLRTVKTVTFADSPYPVSQSDSVLYVDAFDGAVTINMPFAAQMKERIITIKKVDDSLNIVTVLPSGFETIDGITNNVINAQYMSRDYGSDGLNLFVH